MLCSQCNTSMLQIPLEGILYCSGCRHTEPLKRKLVPVFKGGKCAYKYENGELVTPFKYDPCDSPWMILMQMTPYTLVCLRGKYTLLDENGNEKFPFQYDMISYAREGLYTVMKSGKYGFINEQGEIVIDLIYDYAFEFSEGLAAVSCGYKFGYINPKNEVVIPFQYEHADEFYGNLAKVQLDGMWGCIDIKGDVVVPFEYDEVKIEWGKYAVVILDDSYGCFSATGKMLLPAEYSFITFEEENLLMARLESGDETWWKVENDRITNIDDTFQDEEDRFDAENNLNYVEPESSASTFSNEIGFSEIPTWEMENCFPKFLNEWNEGLTTKFCAENQTKLSRLHYEVRHTAPNGLSYALYQNKVGFIDSDCQVVIPFQYDYLNYAQDGFIVASKNGHYGVIDVDHNVIIPFIYDEIKIYYEQRFQVREGSKWGIVNADFQLLVPIEYDPFECYMELGTIIAKKNGKYGLVNCWCEELIPFIYDEVCSSGFRFDNGTCCYRKGDTWYLIDRTNCVIQTNPADENEMF